jgi:multisubunit Na+/H+ antiporter MnhC subunit
MGSIGCGGERNLSVTRNSIWGSGSTRTSSITNLGKIHDFTKFKPPLIQGLVLIYIVVKSNTLNLIKTLVISQKRVILVLKYKSIHFEYENQIQ